jgi:hypothetical protein
MKKTVLLKEYKEGFSEIQKLVDSFDAIEFDSQETFIRERRNILKQQLEFVETQRVSVFSYLRSILAKANSRLKALTDMQDYIIKELKRCEETEELLSMQEVDSTAE